MVLGLVTVLRPDSSEDHLTGLANRRSWDNRLEDEIERTKRTGPPLSVAMIDIDDFKSVNDREGHEAGDLLLKGLSSTWLPVVRSSGDFIARIGGDEFGVLAPDTDADGLRRVTSRLSEVTPNGLVCSIGVATWNGEGSASNLARRADLSMYRDKMKHQCR
ncbi:MAG: GGDEF domain-containing protein [Acidimicrobiales bacterium]